MKITNIHRRIIDKTIQEVGYLLNTLASNDDKLWPHENWAPIKFDRELSIGAIGGHGPICYEIIEFELGKIIKFKFREPADFLGHHWFEVIQINEESTELSHVIDMEVKGLIILPWLLVIRPMHDALIEESFDKAQLNLGFTIKPKKWSPWVRLVKKIIKRKQA